MIRVDTGLSVHYFETPSEAKAFAEGYCDAVSAYGIWKDGQQRIGCMEKPIVPIKSDMMALVNNAINTSERV